MYLPPVLRRLPRLAAQLRAATLSGPFRAFRHPDFARFATGQTISLVGTWMQTVAQGWLVLELTGSAFQVGLVTTLNTLPILLLTLYGGVVADRVDKRRFIIFLQAMMMVEAGVLAALTLSGHVTVTLVFALALVHGLATAFEVPARQAFLVELVPPEELVSAAALNSTIYNLARVLGPAVAGVVIAASGPGAAFALNSVSYIAVIIGLIRIRHRAPRRVHSERPSIFTGVRFIAARPVLAGLAMQMTLVSVFTISFIPILPVFAKDVLGTDAAGYGALTSAVGIGAAFGAIIVGGIGRRVSRSRLANIGGTLLAAFVVLLSLQRELTPALVVLALGGAAMATAGISTATSLQLAATSEVRGRVMAVYSFVVLGLAPIGALQAGWVAEHFGAGRSILVSGTISLAGMLWLRRRLWNPVEE